MATFKKRVKTVERLFKLSRDECQVYNEIVLRNRELFYSFIFKNNIHFKLKLIFWQSIPSLERHLRWVVAISPTWAWARSEANSTHPDIRLATRPTWRAPTTLCWPDPTRTFGSTLISSKCAPTTPPSSTGMKFDFQLCLAFRLIIRRHTR